MAAAISFIVLFTTYTAWNAANPERTCARCHEINPSFETWQKSSHREISCLACHGTAFSNGLHSLREKGNMVLTHLAGSRRSSDVGLSEEQVIETMSRCIGCHQMEYTRWLSGGHSANYAHIFLDEAHNSMERPYWDCLRCHGMYYEGTIYDLMEPISTEGPWRLKDERQAERPVIPCLACHQIHDSNEMYAAMVDYSNPQQTFYNRKEHQQGRNPAAGLYLRADQMFLRADKLPHPDIYHKGRKVSIAADPIQRLCIQCHSPNYRGIAGSQDDRTPTGVHEGLSCISCHEIHSNDASRSCDRCHPGQSLNCGLDVRTMNTSYFDPASKNNIHFVSCEDCHDEKLPARFASGVKIDNENK